MRQIQAESRLKAGARRRLDVADLRRYARDNVEPQRARSEGDRSTSLLVADDRAGLEADLASPGRRPVERRRDVVSEALRESCERRRSRHAEHDGELIRAGWMQRSRGL